METSRTYRLGVVALHPIPYQVPLWTRLGQHPRITLQVLYLEDVYVKGRELDYGSDYDYKFVSNWSHNPHSGFLRRVNPGLIRELRQAHFDAVIVHGWDVLSSWIALAGARFSDTPVILRGEASLNGQRAGWRQIVKGRMLPIVFNAAQKVLYSCTGNRQYFEHYRVPDEKLVLFPCAVDNERFQQEAQMHRPQRERIRTKLDVKPDELLVIMLARMIPIKRPLDLLQAIDNLRDHHPAVKAAIIGKGPMIPDMERFVEKRQLDNAHILGFKHYDQIGPYLVAADVGVILSEYDPSPKALNEMLNFGLPTIVTDVIGTAPDLVHPGNNGYTIPVGDVAALTQHLQHLSLNPDEVRQMGHNALARINQWSFDHDVAAIVQTLDQIANPPQHVRP